MTTNITIQHRQAFEALVSGQYNNFALFGAPGVSAGKGAVSRW